MSVVFPLPFLPTRQMRSPGKIEKLMSSNNGFPPKERLTSFKVKSGGVFIKEVMGIYYKKGREYTPGPYSLKGKEQLN
jgi:hypothetical protein